MTQQLHRVVMLRAQSFWIAILIVIDQYDERPFDQHL